MSTMKDLARIVADRHDLPRQEAEQFLADMFDLLKSGLTADEQVKIKGLGTFKVQTMQERKSVNVNTGEEIIIDSHDRISFTPDASMKESVNKPFAHFETVPINDGVVFEDIEDLPADNAIEKSEPEVEVKPAPVVESKPESETVAEVEPIQPVVQPLFQPVVPEPVAETQPVVPEQVAETQTEPVAEIETEVETELPPAEPVVHEVSGPATEMQETVADIQPEAEPVITEADNQPIPEDKNKAISEPHNPAISEPENKTTEPGNKTISEPDRKTAGTREPTYIEQEKTTNINMAYNSNIDPSKDNDKIGIGMAMLLCLLVLIVGIVIGRATADITFDDLKERIYPSEPEPIEDTVEVTLLTDSTTNSTDAPETATDANASDDKNAVDAAAEKVAAEKTAAEKAAAEKVAAEKVAAEKAAAEKTAAEQKAAEAKAKAAEAGASKYDSDPRVRLGAYRIVGVQKTVTVRAGQTLASISKTYLGPGMECYVEAINGVKEVQEGQQIKIPELALKKKKN